MAQTLNISGKDKEMIKRGMEAAKAKAREMNQEGINMALARGDGTILATDFVEKANCFKNTAAGKVKALANGNHVDDPGACKAICVVCFFCCCSCCGGSLAIPGGLQFRVNGEEYIFSASGATDPYDDEKVSIAAIEAMGGAITRFPIGSPNAAPKQQTMS